MRISTTGLLIVGVLIGLATFISVIAYSISLGSSVDDVDDRVAELEGQIAALQDEQVAADYFSQVSIEVTDCRADLPIMARDDLPIWARVEVTIRNTAGRPLLVDWFAFDARPAPPEAEAFDLVVQGLLADGDLREELLRGRTNSRWLSLVPPGTTAIPPTAVFLLGVGGLEVRDCGAAILDVSLPIAR